MNKLAINVAQKKDITQNLLSFLPIKTNDFSNASLLKYFHNSWFLSDVLYSSITKPNAIYTAPDPLRHSLIFYLGHTAVFYMNTLKKSGILQKGINVEYENLFAKGVDPKTEKELNSNFLWPKEEEVWRYRSHVFEMVSEIIETNKVKFINQDNPLWALLMAIEHDRIHFETSSVLIRQYPTDCLTAPSEWQYAPIDNNCRTLLKMIPISEGNITLGKPENFPTFGWDNEYGRLNVQTRPFYISNHLVSNEEFQKFVLDGGYNKVNFWTKEGWAWKEKTKTRHPKFWVQQDDRFLYRAMFDVINLPLYWPAEVNFHEAQAYCAWKGERVRLPTEAEFERLATEVSPPNTEEDVFSCSDYNLNLKYGSPCSIGTCRESGEGAEFSDVYGNVWQWVSNEFYPLPGFKTHSFYPDFSFPYFTPKHAMLKGNSWATTGTGASKYYRLWFRKHFFQHAGFRIVQDMQ